MPLREEEILDRLRPIFDPELDVSVVDLGLIYSVAASEDGAVRVVHTLTTPGCPIGSAVSQAIRAVLAETPGVTSVETELTWDPPWHVGMINETGRRRLGMDGPASP